MPVRLNPIGLNSKKVGTPIQFIGVFVLLLTISTILAEDIHSNCGGPDRSIQLQSFQTGHRYRNRRLGDFLKELDLTEGKATGIPTVFKELKKNGSPEPRFNTDDDRTFFEVELFIHPAFKTKSPFTTDLSKINWSLAGINELLNLILENAEIIETGGIAGNQANLPHNTDCQALGKEGSVMGNQVSNQAVGIAGNQASNQAELLHSADNQELKIIKLIEGNQADTIARAIASVITENQIKLLNQCKKANTKEIILSAIKLSSQRKNYLKYVKPLIDLDWLTMTIPQKPTSPNQQYLTTLKGRLILEFLKHQNAKT
jgi:hypothetical protein